MSKAQDIDAEALKKKAAEARDALGDTAGVAAEKAKEQPAPAKGALVAVTAVLGSLWLMRRRRKKKRAKAEQ